jgi:hypothetical protein
MTIDNIIQQSKAFNNAHAISKVGDSIQIKVSQNNKWKLLIIGVVALLTPWFLRFFLPMDSESNIALHSKIQWICYGLAALLIVVFFIQKNQKTEIHTRTKVVTYKNQKIKPEEIVDFQIEEQRVKQLNMHSIYLETTSQEKILIGSTTSSSDIAIIQKIMRNRS